MSRGTARTLSRDPAAGRGSPPCPACRTPAPAAAREHDLARQRRGSSRAAAWSRSSSTVGADAQSRGCTTATTRSPHSGSGGRPPRRPRRPGGRASTRSTIAAGTLTPPLMTTSSARPSTSSRLPSGAQRPRSAWCRPPTSAGSEVRPQPVAREHDRSAELDPAVVAHDDLDAVERPAVVDAAPAGLGHPVRRDHPHTSGRRPAASAAGPGQRRRRGSRRTT